MVIANTILVVLLAYTIVGLIFGAAFVTIGVQRVDHAARDASVAFRLLILPGVAALWPCLAVQWLRWGRGKGAAS